MPSPSAFGRLVADAQPSAASFAGSEPSAVKSGGNVFLEPEPVALAPRTRPFQLPEVAGGSEDVNRLIEKYAAHYNVPVALVRRVVKRESNFRPSAYNRGHGA